MLALTSCLGVALAVPAGSAEGSQATAPAEARPMHESSAALERALLDAMQALSRGDTAALRTGLDGMEKACRRTAREEPFDKEVYQFDLAFHAALDRARELAGAGDVEKAAQQFCWIQNGCRRCHEIARKGAQPRP